MLTLSIIQRALQEKQEELADSRPRPHTILNICMLHFEYTNVINLLLLEGHNLVFYYSSVHLDKEALRDKTNTEGIVLKK